jgi:hypothetical protein
MKTWLKGINDTAPKPLVCGAKRAQLQEEVCSQLEPSADILAHLSHHTPRIARSIPVWSIESGAFCVAIIRDRLLQEYPP